MPQQPTLEVDPSEVHSIEVDPSQVSEWRDTAAASGQTTIPVYSTTVTAQSPRGFWGRGYDWTVGLAKGIGDELANTLRYGPPARRALRLISLGEAKAHGKTLTADEEQELAWLEQHAPLQPAGFGDDFAVNPMSAPIPAAVQDVRAGDYTGAAGDLFFGYGVPAAAGAAIRNPAVVRDAVVGGVKGGAGLVKVPRMPIRLPASIAGAAAGGLTGEFIGRPFGFGNELGQAGVATGAIAPVVRGAVNEVKAGIAERAAAQAAAERAAAPQVPLPEYTGDIPAGTTSADLLQQEIAAKAAQAEAAGPNAALLDEIASDPKIFGKPFSKLTPSEQELVRKIADADTAARTQPVLSDLPNIAPAAQAGPVLSDLAGRPPEIQSRIPPGTMPADLVQQYLAEKRAQAAAAPVPPPEPPAQTGSVGDLTQAIRGLIARRQAAAAPPETPPEIAPETPPQTVETLSNLLNKSLGIEPDEAPPAPRPYDHTPQRVKAAHSMADYITDKLGYGPEDLPTFESTPDSATTFWRNIGEAHRHGYNPDPETMQMVRDFVSEKTAPAAESAPAPADNGGYNPGDLYNPNAIQKLIDLQESKLNGKAAPVEQSAPVQGEQPTLSGLRYLGAKYENLTDQISGLQEQIRAIEGAREKAHVASMNRAGRQASKRGVLGDYPLSGSAKARAKALSDDTAAGQKISALQKQLEELQAARNAVWDGHDVEANDFFDYIRSGRELPPDRAALYAKSWMNPNAIQKLIDLQEGKRAGVAASEPVSLSDRLQAAADAASERMRKRGSFNGTKLNSMPDPQDVGDLAIWGGAKLAQGTVDFAKWSKEMVAEFGPEVKPALPMVYTEAQKVYARNIKSTGDNLPNTKQLLQLWKEGKDGAEWYNKTRAELEQTFGPEGARLFVDMLAATTNNQTVAGNLTLALQAYKQYRLGQPWQGYMRSVMDQLDKAVAGEPFGGSKVKSFRANLFGDEDPVTVDRWMARAFGFDKGQPEGPQYKFIDYWTTQLAKRVGMSPRETQAAIWKAYRDRAGSANTGKSFEELLPDRLAKDPELRALVERAKAGEAAPPRPTP